MEQATKGTTKRNRMNIGNMATSMYAERVAEDTKAGKGAIYQDNPQARQLYFKGVHDVLTCLDIWLKQGVSPDQLSKFMDELHAQTAPIATGPTH